MKNNKDDALRYLDILFQTVEEEKWTDEQKKNVIDEVMEHVQKVQTLLDNNKPQVMGNCFVGGIGRAPANMVRLGGVSSMTQLFDLKNKNVIALLGGKQISINTDDIEQNGQRLLNAHKKGYDAVVVELIDLGAKQQKRRHGR